MNKIIGHLYVHSYLSRHENEIRVFSLFCTKKGCTRFCQGGGNAPPPPPVRASGPSRVYIMAWYIVAQIVLLNCSN